MFFTLYTFLLVVGFMLVLVMSAEDRDGPDVDQRGGGGGGGRRLAKIPVRSDQSRPR